MTVRPQDSRLLALALGVLAASAAIGAAIGASRLGLVVPAARPGSLGDATAILANNMRIGALLAALTLLQPRGVPGLTPGFLPRWLTDLTVAVVVTVNLVAIGGVVGALGMPALLRIAPHAPPEIGAYAILVTGYLRARRGELQRDEALRMFALAGILIACGSWVESYVSGALG